MLVQGLVERGVEDQSIQVAVVAVSISRLLQLTFSMK